MIPTMTAAQLETALAGLGLEPLEAADALGVSVRTVYAWLAGTRPVAGPVVVLVELLERDHARSAARSRRRARAGRPGGGQGRRPAPVTERSGGAPARVQELEGALRGLLGAPDLEVAPGGTLSDETLQAITRARQVVV